MRASTATHSLWRRAACAVLAASALAGPAPAGAHDTGPTPGHQATPATSAARQAPESADAKHAGEHAAIDRAIQRFDRLSPRRKRLIRQRLLGKTRGTKPTRARAAAAAQPADVGSWNPTPFPAPDYAIHAVLLTGGRVLLFSMGSGHGVGPGASGNSGQEALNDGQATIWDPALGQSAAAFKDVDPPPIPLDDPLGRPGSSTPRPAPLFCAGQVQLADGRVLIAGGNLEAASPGYGLKILFLFDPRTDSWVREPDMFRARWYPTLTRLPSGRVAILGGQDEAGKSVTSFELYPSAGTAVAGVDEGAPLSGIATSEPAARRDNGMYPHSFVLPSGRLASSSWGAGPMSLFEPTTGRWVTRNTQQLAINGSYPTAFPAPGDQHGTTELIQAGGNVSGFFGPQLSNQVYAISPEQEKTWRAQPSLNVARRNSTAVLLPDGTAITVGGGLTDLRFSGDPGAIPQKQVELWDPATRTWTVGPAQKIPRGYHSIALLLADGRVLSAGDDYTASLLDTNRSDAFDSLFEIYSPPYLFRGARPQIEAAPGAAGYGDSLELRATVSTGRRITRATLVAPGSVTHAFNMNQRVLELPIVDHEDGTYSVQGPTTSAAAPPGDYMLFLLNDLGVPSVAAWVRIRPDFPGQGTPTLTRLPDEPLPDPAPQPAPSPGPAPVDQTAAARAAAVAQLRTFLQTSTTAAETGMRTIAKACPEPKKAARTTRGKRRREARMRRCRTNAVRAVKAAAERRR